MECQDTDVTQDLHITNIDENDENDKDHTGVIENVGDGGPSTKIFFLEEDEENKTRHTPPGPTAISTTFPGLNLLMGPKSEPAKKNQKRQPSQLDTGSTEERIGRLDANSDESPLSTDNAVAKRGQIWHIKPDYEANHVETSSAPSGVIPGAEDAFVPIPFFGGKASSSNQKTNYWPEHEDADNDETNAIDTPDRPPTNNEVQLHTTTPKMDHIQVFRMMAMANAKYKPTHHPVAGRFHPDRDSTDVAEADSTETDLGRQKMKESDSEDNAGSLKGNQAGYLLFKNMDKMMDFYKKPRFKSLLKPGYNGSGQQKQGRNEGTSNGSDSLIFGTAATAVPPWDEDSEEVTPATVFKYRDLLNQQHSLANGIDQSGNQVDLTPRTTNLADADLDEDLFPVRRTVTPKSAESTTTFSLTTMSSSITTRSSPTISTTASTALTTNLSELIIDLQKQTLPKKNTPPPERFHNGKTQSRERPQNNLSPVKKDRSNQSGSEDLNPLSKHTHVQRDNRPVTATQDNRMIDLRHNGKNMRRHLNHPDRKSQTHTTSGQPVMETQTVPLSTQESTTVTTTTRQRNNKQEFVRPFVTRPPTRSPIRNIVILGSTEVPIPNRVVTRFRNKYWWTHGATPKNPRPHATNNFPNNYRIKSRDSATFSGSDPQHTTTASGIGGNETVTYDVALQEDKMATHFTDISISLGE